MADLNETLAAIAGDVKVVYGQTLTQLLPDSAILQKKFTMSDNGDYPYVGDYFSALVSTQLPQGFSFCGAGTEATTTNETLGAALAGQTLPAKIYGNMTVLQDNLQYFVLLRAPKAGPQAVMSALTLTGKQMAMSMRNVLELQTLHGREGLGAASGAISTLTVTFDPATTSPGILSQLLGARVQWMQSNNTSARTANDASNYLTVASINLSDPNNPTLTMVATGTTNVAAITTGDIMYYAGARGVTVASSDVNVTQYEQVGLGRQLRATTGTDCFAIDKAVNSGWVSNTLSSVGNFSPSVLMTMAQLSLSRGGELGDYIAVCSPRQWAVLNSALATNETYNQQSPSFAMSKKTGTDEIEIAHSGVHIEVISHPFQKDGQAYLMPVSQVHRIGSTDISFSIPGRPSDEYIYPIPGKAVIARQCHADWQMALLKPPSATIATGITF